MLIYFDSMFHFPSKLKNNLTIYNNNVFQLIHYLSIAESQTASEKNVVTLLKIHSNITFKISFFKELC